MVGGDIIDSLVIKDLEDFQEILFLVRGRGSEANDTCCVQALIPKSVKPEIKLGDSIWWQSGEVYLNMFNEQDIPFKKLGYSGGTAKDFYRKALLKSNY